MKNLFWRVPWIFGFVNVFLKLLVWYTAGGWVPLFWMKIDYPVSLVLEPIVHPLGAYTFVYLAIWLLVGFLWYFAIGWVLRRIVTKLLEVPEWR